MLKKYNNLLLCDKSGLGLNNFDRELKTTAVCINWKGTADTLSRLFPQVSVSVMLNSVLVKPFSFLNKVCEFQFDIFHKYSR